MENGDRRTLTPTNDGASWLWLALGCGGLILTGLCVVPPVVYFLAAAAPRAETEPLQPSVAPPPIAPALPTSPNAPTTPSLPANPVAPPPAAGNLTSTRTVSVSITEVRGLTAVQVGSTCSFPVTQSPRRDGTFWCNAQIRCGSVLLYGGATAGYFDCTLYEQPERHVVGEDRDTTSGDRDAAMRLDTLREELEVRDDATGRLGAFTVRARVTSVQ